MKYVKDNYFIELHKERDFLLREIDSLTTFIFSKEFKMFNEEQQSMFKKKLEASKFYRGVIEDLIKSIQ